MFYDIHKITASVFCLAWGKNRVFNCNTKKYFFIRKYPTFARKYNYMKTKKKAGRPKVDAKQKIVPVSIGVPAIYKMELYAKFKQIANEYKLCSSLENS